MDKRLKIILIVGFITGLLIFIYFFIKNMPVNNPLAPKAATVNGISITKAEYQKQVNFIKNFYEYSKQDLKNYPTLEKDALDRLIEDKLIEDYAKKHNITVTDSEVMALYKQKLSAKTESQLLTQLKQMYGMDKNDYLEVLRIDILREKTQNAVKIPLKTWLAEEKKTANISIVN